MKRILALWLAAILFAVQPCYAVVMVGFGVSGGTCDPATDFIGDKDAAGSTSQTAYINVSYAYLWQPSCSGPLNTAFLYKSNTKEQTANLAIYLDDGDGVPDDGDTLVAYTSAALSANAVGFASGALNSNPTVSMANSYWILFEPSSAQWQYSYDSIGTSYYKTTTFGGAWPDTLPTTWSTLTRRPVAYITIGS